MENLRFTSNGRFESLVASSKNPQLIEMLDGMKGFAFILDLVPNDPRTRAYFKPEQGVVLTLDQRVPKPEEIYRNVAYYRMDKLLGWEVSSPVLPWRFDQMKGTISPFWKDIEIKEVFMLKPEILNNKNFWTKVAVLDYICSVTDRSYNDVKFVNKQPVVTDSGLSFVDGVEFVAQQKYIRDALSGEQITNGIRKDLKKMNFENVIRITDGLLKPNQVDWILKRVKRVLDEGIVV